MSRNKLKIGDIVQIIPDYRIPSDGLYAVLDVKPTSVTLEPLGINLAASAIRISTVSNLMVERATAGYVDGCLKRAARGQYGVGRNNE